MRSGDSASGPDAELLRRSEERYRLLVEAARDYALFVLDPGGHIVTWNPGAERIKGYRAEEIIGRHFSAFYPPEDVAADKPGWELRVAEAEGRVEDEGWRLRKDGARFWANVVITALRDAEGRLVGFSKITRDLTERKAAEEALRRSEERYRLLVESVKDYAIYLLDPAGHVVTWNAGAERIKGYRAEEIIGRHFSAFYPPEDVAADKPGWELRVAEAEDRVEDEGWRLRKDGARFWANVVLTALRDPDGRLVGFAKVTRDLTERVQAEQQARELAAARAARAEAEAASRRKDEFLSMLAHELRNPLAPVVTGMELLRQAGGDAATRGQVLDMVDRQMRHLRRMVDDLLDVARFLRGKVELRCRRLDLGRLARAAAEDRRAGFHKAGLTLTASVPDTPVWVQADEARLAQVLGNLLDNAAKFTDPGGRAEVRVAAEPASAAAHTRGGGGWAVLTVSDTGIGIPAGDLPEVFTAFAQADRSLERTRGGLGLGLSVVKGLVELHGGAVEAASDGPGRGATFTVRLPLEQEPAALADSPATGVPTAARRRILVVEDNRDAADTLRMFLEARGHEVRVAYTGPEGVREATAWLPDVVLLDIGLPGLDGYALARRLRGEPGLEKALLAALTGYGGEDDRRRSREAGFDHHLVKPADPADLLRVLAGRVA
jgi:PAS domain S-box-containing protein